MERYRIQIDQDACVADGLCCEEAPGTFARDADNRVRVIDQAGNSPHEIYRAALRCPLEAIRLFDADTGGQIWPVG